MVFLVRLENTQQKVSLTFFDTNLQVYSQKFSIYGKVPDHAPARSVALEKGRRPPFAYHAHAFSPPTLASLWVQRWHQRLSTWLYLAISKHVMRLLCPNIVARLRYI